MRMKGRQRRREGETKEERWKDRARESEAIKSHICVMAPLEREEVRLYLNVSQRRTKGTNWPGTVGEKEEVWAVGVVMAPFHPLQLRKWAISGTHTRSSEQG